MLYYLDEDVNESPFCSMTCRRFDGKRPWSIALSGVPMNDRFDFLSSTNSTWRYVDARPRADVFWPEIIRSDHWVCVRVFMLTVNPGTLRMGDSLLKGMK